MDEQDFPERWTSPRLAELVEGTTAKWWRTKGIPLLLQRGALRKVGHGCRGYIGSRSDIRTALMGAE